MKGGAAPTDEEAAMTKSEEAIESVLTSGEAIDLQPQNSSFIRRLRHQLVEQPQCRSESIGVEPKHLAW